MEDDSFDDDAQPWYEVDTRSTSKAVQDDVLLNGQIDIADLSRAELKANLKARGLEATGHKALLRERLQNAVKQRYLESAEHLARVEEERVAEVKLEESGSVYTVGANHQGQLGLGDREPRNLFQVIESLRGKHVDMVFAGMDYCFALTESQDVYAWGGGGMAPLGIEKGGNREYDDDGFSSYAGSEIGEEYLHPQYVERLRGEGIVDMDCKFGHVAAISDGGDLFTWGVGRHGQLGQGTFIDSEFPTLVETLRNTFVVGVSVGHSHSLCLSDDDTTYAFGFTHRGKLGLGTLERKGAPERLKKYFPAPTVIPSLHKQSIHQVACSANHSIAVSTNRRTVFTWGSGDGGRLGHGDKKDRLEPTEIKEFENQIILQVACGQWHSAAIVLRPPLARSGDLYTWGSGYSGQLGRKKETMSLKPKIVPYFPDNATTVKFISCGPTHNAIISDDDQLFTWGSNKFGCLGCEIPDEYTWKPHHVPVFDVMLNGIGRGPARSVACGKEFTVVACHPYVGLTEEELIQEERREAQRSEATMVAKAETELKEQQAQQAREQEQKRIADAMRRVARPSSSAQASAKDFL